MPEPKKEPIAGELENKKREGVQGGMIIPPSGPALKAQVPGSIAQGDTISIDDNLRDAGGGPYGPVRQFVRMDTGVLREHRANSNKTALEAIARNQRSSNAEICYLAFGHLANFGCLST